MKNFNIRRFGCLLRLDAVQNARGYIAFGAGMLLSHWGAQVGIMRSFYAADNVTEFMVNAALNDCCVVFTIISIIVLLVGISDAFSVLATKPKRTDYLLLPASRTEKFLVRLLICTVGIWLLNLLAFCVADGLRQLFFYCWNLGDGGQALSIPSSIPAVWKWLGEGTHFLLDVDSTTNKLSISGYWLTGCSVGLTLMVYLFYFLGSAVFRRRVFIYTSVVGVLLLLGGLRIVKTGMHLVIELSFSAGNDSEYTLIAITVGSFLLAALFVWAAWRIFSRTGVVRRKLI